MIEPSLQIGGGNWANKSDSLLGYHKEGANFYADELTFSRNSLGSYTDANGLVQSMPYNLLQQSNTFNTTWNLSGATLTSGQSGYDGTNNAWLLSKDAGQYRRVYQNVSFSGVYTLSVYAKSNTLNQLSLRDNPSATLARFDLSNGSLISTSGSPIATSIVSVGGGWYRCSLTMLDSVQPQIYVDWSQSDAGSIYIQDAQLNQGSTALPYFATTTRLNLARVDYKDNVNGSLLLEPQRTNLVTWSNSNNLNFALDNVSMAYNSIVSPDGTTNGILFKQTGTTNSNSAYNYGLTTADGTYTYSIFLKASDSELIRIYSSNGAATLTQDFDPQTMTDGILAGSLNLNFQDYGNGWFRMSFTRTLSSAANHRLSIYPDRNNTQKGLYIYGIQVELGSYPTSYIKSEGAATTRLADTIPTYDITSFSIGNSYTILIDAELNALENNKVFFTGKTSASTDSFTIRNFNGLLRLYNNIDSAYPVGAISSSTNKWVLRIDGTSYKIFAYGSTLASTFTTARNLGKVNFDGSLTELKMQNLTIFPSALSDADCISLTL